MSAEKHKAIVYIENCDLLVKPFQFRTQGKNNGKTLAGGILTLFILLFVVLYLVQYLIRQLAQKNIIYAGSTIFDHETYLMNEELKFVVMLANHSNLQELFHNETLHQYIDLVVEQVVQTRMLNGTVLKNITKIKMEKCSEEYLQTFNFIQQDFSASQWDQLVCPQGSYKIQGTYYDESFSYIRVIVLPCQNSSSKQCKDQSEIDKSISQSIDFDMFIQDSRVKNEYSGNPVEYTPTNIYWKLNSLISNNQDIFITPIQIDMKSFDLFEYFSGTEGRREQIFSSYKVDGIDRRQSQIVFGQPYSSMFIRVNQQKNNYFIINDDVGIIFMLALSEIGGLLVSIFTIMRFIYHPYSVHKRYESLMKSTYHFDLKQGSGNVNRIKQSLFKQHNQYSADLRNLLGCSFKYPFLQYVQYDMLRQFQYYFGCACLTIRTWLFKSREEELAITHLSKEKIEYDLCLSNLLRKLYEIDCIKLYLFDAEQLVIFNSFSQPVIQNQAQPKQFKINQMTQSQAYPNPMDLSAKRQVRMTDLVQDKSINNNNIEIVPVSTKLGTINDFFVAQYEETNADRLIDIYNRIKNNTNLNNKLNSRFLMFLKYNKRLFNLVDGDFKSRRQTLNFNNIQLKKSVSIENIRSQFNEGNSFEMGNEFLQQILSEPNEQNQSSDQHQVVVPDYERENFPHDEFQIVIQEDQKEEDRMNIKDEQIGDVNNLMLSSFKVHQDECQATSEYQK